jgi:diaminopimelate decarboxylase
LRIVDIAKKNGKSANISLRVVPNVMGGTAAGFETGHSNSKFGLMPSDLDIVAPIILANRRNINYKGFHYHVGSQVVNHQAFTNALSNILGHEYNFYKNTGLKSSCLNMGGGFPIPLAPYNSMPTHENGNHLPLEVQKIISGNLTVDEIAKALSSTWDCSDTNLNKNETLVQIEPGRRIIGDAGILLTTVEHLKKRPNGTEWAMLDVGFNILPEILFYDWYYHVVSTSRFGEAHDKYFRLAGPLCDTGDSFHDERAGTKLPDARPLPASTQQGDILAILNTGSYAIEQQSNYNGRPKASAVIIKTSGDIQVI